MNKQSADQPVKNSNELAQERTDLALERTRIAEERTMMAWIRTSVSLISFGFTIYNFFRVLWQSERGLIHRPQAPRNFGLTLIALGTIILIFAAIEHWSTLRDLRQLGASTRISLALIVAVLMTLVGIVAFLSVYFRTGPF